MVLYHGTNIDFNTIDLQKCNPNKDFGRGFYLTDDVKQAEQMAVRRVRIVGKGEPIILQYNFNENVLMDHSLSVKIFEIPTEEWALFILNNRKTTQNNFMHNYDIVIGPIANDGVVFQLDRYEQHIIDLSTLVKELTYRNLNKQYFFGTEKALLKLNRI